MLVMFGKMNIIDTRQKDGYILKTGKNSDAFQEIRNYLQEKSNCKNSECKTIKKTDKDLKFIQSGGFCMECTIDKEHQIRTAGLWVEYQNYKSLDKDDCIW